MPYSISLIGSEDLGAVLETVKVNNLNELAHYTLNSNWAPAIYDESNRRTINNCLYTSFFVLDIDGGTTVSNVKTLLSGYRLAITSTRHHMVPKYDSGPEERFRVILPLSENINSDRDFKSTFQAIKNLIPEIDSSCKDISRFFYPGQEILYLAENGENFPVTKSTASVKEEPAPDNKKRDNKGALSKATKDFLLNLAPKGERHAKMVKALFDFKEQGYTIEEARDYFKQAYKLNTEPWGRDQEKRIKDVYENRASKYPGGRWPDTIVTKEGVPRPDPNSANNYQYLIEDICGVKPSLNLLDYSIYIQKYRQIADLSLQKNRQITDLDLYKICIKARECKLLASRQILSEYIYKIAEENSFHPIKDPIDATFKNAGSGHIDALIDTIKFNYEIAEEESAESQHERYRKYITKWLVGAMAKLYRPGAQNVVLVFQGAQGAGKSTWLERLALWPAAYKEGHVVPGNKDHELYHLTKFIWHIPELDTVTSKRETGALKDFLTRRFVSERPAYGQFNVSGESICNFVASVNDEAFLNDYTGNRRYMIVPVLSMDAHHSIDISKVFSEARALLENGYQYWLDRDEIEELEAASQVFAEDSIIGQMAATIQTGDTFLPVKDIFERFGYYNPRPSDFKKLTALLKKRGIYPVRQRFNGGRPRGYLVATPVDNPKSASRPSPDLSVLNSGGSSDKI